MLWVYVHLEYVTFNDISLEVFHDHFKKLNQAEIDETEINWILYLMTM